MPDTVIDVADIVTAFGQYYLGSANTPRLDFIRNRPFVPFGTKEALTLVPTDATRYTIGIEDMKEILQAYQDTYTPKGEVKFSPKHIDLVQVKIDQKFNPNKLMDTFLGWFAQNRDRVTAEGGYPVDRSEWLFVKWFIEEYLQKQSDEDIETKSIYKGVRQEPTPGTAGAAINAMTGIKKVLNDGITANEIIPITTGAISTDPVTFVGQVENFVKSIDEDLVDSLRVLNMSNTLASRFREGMRLKYNMQYSQVANRAVVADNEHIEIKGRRSMQGSTKIWGALPGTMVMPVKGYSNKNAFMVKEFLRDVYIYTDWWMGVGYKYGGFVFTNDVELT